MEESRPLEGHPDSYIRKVIAQDPNDPRYLEALRELNRRQIVPDIVLIPDEVLEKVLCYLNTDIFEQETACGSRIKTLRRKAAQALGNVDTRHNSSETVLFKNLYWDFQCIDDHWILEDVREIK